MNPTKSAHIAVDFGGGSGRVIAGCFSPDGELTLTEIHRFTNRPSRLGTHFYWDFPALYEEMIEGLRLAVAAGFEILSVGVDTWGVDFGLVCADGSLVSLPYCYRDEATIPYPERFAATHDPADHYAEAGIQVMAINTLYRLMAINDANPELLRAARHLLFTPDLFCYYLTGVAVNEYTIASTSELLDARTRTWNRSLIRSLGLPQELFGEIVMPGTIRGYLTDAVMARIGADPTRRIPVVAVPSHDTASAVSASQASSDPSTAFLSSGTWSLLGAVVAEPVLTEEARVAGFTNEGAAGGKIRFLQNITGLWILQRLEAEWRREGCHADYPTLIAEAEEAKIDTIIDVDDPAFSNPASMSEAIRQWCEARGHRAPASRGEMVRVVLASLAERYRKGIESLNRLLPSPVTKLNIFGGGSRNTLLNRLTAEATGLEITAGPVEATAIGNITSQHEALATLQASRS